MRSIVGIFPIRSPKASRSPSEKPASGSDVFQNGRPSSLVESRRSIAGMSVADRPARLASPLLSFSLGATSAAQPPALEAVTVTYGTRSVVGRSGTPPSTGALVVRSSVYDRSR